LEKIPCLHDRNVKNLAFAQFHPKSQNVYLPLNPFVNSIKRGCGEFKEEM
jgi:hypothetical protein